MKKIIIIEDDFYIRGLYKMTFEKKDYQVTEAANGDEALKKIDKEKFDFAILDLMLPGLPGIEVLKKIRKDHHIPVYVLTNLGDEKSLKEAMAEKADGYFLKVDYTPKQLMAAIEEKQK